MKTTKLIIGIISMVLFLVISLQSCAAGVGNALSQNGESSGSAGFVLAIFMLVAGIIGVATRNGKKGGGITAGIFYVVGGVIGLANVGSFKDLMIWSVLGIIFGAIFLIFSFYKSKNIDVKN